MKKQILFLLMLMPLMASAFTGDVIIDGIKYYIVTKDNVAEVRSNKYSGNIVIPDVIEYEGVTCNVSAIGTEAFKDCMEITSVSIPNSVTSIGYMAFFGCENMVSVSGLDNVTSIDSYAFTNCLSMTSFTIPEKLTSIEECTFLNCKKLASITIPNKVKIIGDRAFCYCESLSSVTIGSGVESINGSAFRGCLSLTFLNLPNNVITIASYALYGCSGLTSITIGNGVKTIGTKAFAGCESLEDVYCHAVNVPSTETNAFDDSYIAYATLHAPESSLSQYQRREPWSGFGTYAGINEEEGDDGNKCSPPIITILANGKIKVESATEGATCITTITASNAEPLTDGEISLTTPLVVYTVTSYATAEGYEDSEVATSSFRWEKTEGDMNGDGQVNISDVVKLVNMILGL